MSARQWASVLGNDGIRVIREPFFVFLMVAPFLFGGLLRWGVPVVADRFRDRIDLEAYYPVIVAIFVIGTALYSTVVMAFQILDEKVENSLLAVAVTPFTLKRYFTLRILLYAGVSIPVMALVHMEAGLVQIAALKLWVVALAVSLQSPLLALLIASLAGNQMEGFAVMKGMGFLVLIPIAMYFVPGYWHLFCGILPAYWPIMAYYNAVEEGGSELFFWLAITIGLVYQFVAIKYLYGHFEKNVLQN